MIKLCPRCQRTFSGDLLCPRCPEKVELVDVADRSQRGIAAPHVWRNIRLYYAARRAMLFTFFALLFAPVIFLTLMRRALLESGLARIGLIAGAVVVPLAIVLFVLLRGSAHVRRADHP